MTTRARAPGQMTIGMDLGDRSSRYCGVDADGIVGSERPQARDEITVTIVPAIDGI